MKIQSIKANNKKRVFEATVSKGVLPMPYAQVEPSPSKSDPIVELYVDPELGGEGFTYVLKSGAEGSVHVDSVLEYNEDPTYLRSLLLHELTIEAHKCLKASKLSQREILRRARTSASQLNRLLDASNQKKSVDGMIRLLGALDCEVEITVKPARSKSSLRRESRRTSSTSQARIA